MLSLWARFQPKYYFSRKRHNKWNWRFLDETASRWGQTKLIFPYLRGDDPQAVCFKLHLLGLLVLLVFISGSTGTGLLCLFVSCGFWVWGWRAAELLWNVSLEICGADRSCSITHTLLLQRSFWNESFCNQILWISMKAGVGGRLKNPEPVAVKWSLNAKKYRLFDLYSITAVSWDRNLIHERVLVKMAT